MNLIPIQVECHCGYKADEYPRFFTRDNERFEIQEITDRWYQGNHDPELPVSDYFKIVTTCGKQYIIKHEVKNDKWYLCEKNSIMLQ
jgi:hypothetical protein